ncbi:MAG: hypothetical protein A3H98_06470 [Bacteroidetes bacterium RIFCSPLOWO2_02_FULL_36_8]|nr:MAG: hypothetical protein A3H98_06470 [Bacteroidetes bacterium RIFCSPLOWO2_02_FULL_36_8]OFY71109.1 MAG: hypothetical protein A3G23_14975 [Bacteroidetes bacterium RIFCSPLOWO2_12_FULL_37_12]
MKTNLYYPKSPLLLNENNPILRMLGFLKILILIFLFLMTTLLVTQARSLHKQKQLTLHAPLLLLETYMYKNKVYLNWSMESDKGIEYRNMIYVLESAPERIKIEYKTGEEGVLKFLGIMERSQSVKEYDFSIESSELTENDEENIIVFFRLTTIDSENVELRSVVIPFPLKNQEFITNMFELKSENGLADVWYSEKK